MQLVDTGAWVLSGGQASCISARARRESIELGNAPSFATDLPVDCTPLLVFVNAKSGGNQGLLILTQMKQLLNPIQVYDLADGDPTAALQKFMVLPRLRLLVCGGDGSVSWVMNSLENIRNNSRDVEWASPVGEASALACIVFLLLLRVVLCLFLRVFSLSLPALVFVFVFVLFVVFLTFSRFPVSTHRSVAFGDGKRPCECVGMGWRFLVSESIPVWYPM